MDVRLFKQRFRVRHDEVDAWGRARSAALINQMTETVIRLAVRLDDTIANPAEASRVWVVRQHDLCILAPPRLGHEVEVTTWVYKFDRLRGYRQYETQNLVTGEIAARAETIWVMVNPHSGQPVRIPQELQDMYLTSGGPVARPPSAATLGPARDWSPRPFRSRRRVQSYEVDWMGHVNNAVYLNWVEQAQLDALAEAGHTPAGWRESALAFVPARHEIKYARPAFEGDGVEIRTRLWAVDGQHLVWEHELTDAGAQLLARDLSTGHFVDLAGRTTDVPPLLLKTITQRGL